MKGFLWRIYVWYWEYQIVHKLRGTVPELMFQFSSASRWWRWTIRRSVRRMLRTL